MLVQILILFFILLIAYQIFLAVFGNLREGLDGSDTNASYKEYDTSGPSGANILAQQNAGNIAYLKQRLDELMDLKGTVIDVCGNIVQLNQQVQGLVQQQADAATQLAGNKPASISGTSSE
jgi:hypothetical protein|uniref:Uncharacterized protein n=1 Tax=viral metagenome TaxID=1070528 RepID=A0A6C0HCY3_9ZZZZ